MQMSIKCHIGWTVYIVDIEVSSVPPEFCQLYVIPIIGYNIGYLSIQGVIDESEHTLTFLSTGAPIGSIPWKTGRHILVLTPHGLMVLLECSYQIEIYLVPVFLQVLNHLH